MKSRTEILVPLAAIQAVPIAVIAWYRLHRYAWYRYCAIVTKRRLMLQLLLRQPFEEESLRSDFIDFCIAKITACSQPYAIRSYCMKLAYEQMKYYPELLEELRMALDMLEQEVLSPGMLSAKRQIMKKIKRSLGKFGK